MRLPIFILPAILAGCALENNRVATTSEGDSLAQITPLAAGFGSIGQASLSRDLRWMIFQAMRSGEDHQQMYLAQVKSTDAGITGTSLPLRISPNNSINSSGRISPDGLSLIFASTAAGTAPAGAGGAYPAAMEIFRADGWQGAVAVAVPGMITDLAQHPLTVNMAYDAECAYSPDGKWIIFTSTRDGDPEVYAMSADGKDPRRLTFRPGYDGEASFSPDGSRIVYRSDSRDRHQICVAPLVFNSAGAIIAIGGRRVITHGLAANRSPAWHPDGRHIIFASNRSDYDNEDLWLMRDDGNAKTRITFSPGADAHPSFSADGAYLLWTTKRGGAVQLLVARFNRPRGS